jgi:hypothetical protein
MGMSKINQKARLVSFERRLEEAQHNALAKEPFSSAFSAGFTTEKLKSWVEVINVIQDRIDRIREEASLE